MPSADEAGPSRRTGRRATQGVSYNVTSAFEGLEGLEGSPEKRAPSTDDSDASEMYEEEMKGKTGKPDKGKGRATSSVPIKKRRVESQHSDSEFDEDEMDAEPEDLDDLRMDNMSAASSMDEDIDSDESLLIEHTERKPRSRGKSKRDPARSLEAFRLQNSTPRDEGDAPSDKTITDFNTVFDPGHTIAHRYILRRDLPKMTMAQRWTHTPIRPVGLTRLKKKPHLGKLSELEYRKVEECGKSDTYNTILEYLSAVPHEVPWDIWRGEGWWSDCWTYDAEGKAKWTSRGKVDVGLRKIGRMKKTELRYLDAEQAKPYMVERSGHKLNLLLGLDNEEAGTKEEKIDIEMFGTRKLGGSSQKQANLFDAGSYVSGLEWCPMSEVESSKRNFELYLAVSTLDRATQPNQTGSLQTSLHGSLQIWTLSPGSGVNETGLGDDYFDSAHDADMKCTMVLCFEGGPIIDFKWMPMGCCDPMSNDKRVVPKIGIISAAMTDGSVRFFAVPDPRYGSTTRDFIHVEPLLILRAEDGACTSLDWGSAGLLAVGLSNGSVCIWNNVVELITGPDTILSPTDQLPAHASAVQSVRWARIPNTDAGNQIRLDLAPAYLVSAAWDGTIALFDTRDARFVSDLEGQPRVHGALDWNPYMESILWVDHEYFGITIKLRKFSQMINSRLQGHEGPILCFGASDYHAMLASGGADGSVTWSNSIQTALHFRKKQVVIAELYQLDLNQNTGEYRMLDRLMPEATTFSRKLVNAGDGTRAPKEGYKKATPVWPSEISITRLAWNDANGIGRAGMLASSSASGLCRIDFMQGYKDGTKLKSFENKVADAKRKAARAQKKQGKSESDEE